MPQDKEGPRVVLECFGCQHHEPRRDYDPESNEVSYEHYCLKDQTGDGRFIGARAETPAWCPCLGLLARGILGDALHAFNCTWARLSAEGACDQVGGQEWRRVTQEWLAAGMPSPIDGFIRGRANVQPEADKA